MQYPLDRATCLSSVYLRIDGDLLVTRAGEHAAAVTVPPQSRRKETKMPSRGTYTVELRRHCFCASKVGIEYNSRLFHPPSREQDETTLLDGSARTPFLNDSQQTEPKAILDHPTPL